MPNTTVGKIVSTGGGVGAGIAAGASWGLALGPWGAAVGAGVGALLGLIGDIGSGRRVANTMTQKGGPQDIINKQLAAISSAQATPEEKAQATQKAWTDFIQATNQFAAQSKEHAQVAKQAIYQTPDLTNTVKSLMGGVDPLGQQFTSTMNPSIATATKQSGITLGSILAPAAAGAAGGLAGAALFPGASTVGAVGSTGATSGVGPLAGIPGAGGALSQPAIAAPGAAPAGASLFSKLFPSLVSSGTSLLSGALGANAAGKAATEQSNAAIEAARIQAEAGTKASELQAKTAAETLAFNRETVAQQQRNIQPWIDSGAGALKTIGEITSAPGYSWNQTYKNPTLEEAMASPELQFQMQQGQKALEAYQRSTGTHLSGAAAKEIEQFGQGVASQNYGNVAARNLQAYSTNYQSFMNERTAQLNPQLALAGLGQTSTGELNSNLGQTANLNANTSMTAAGNIGNIGLTTAANVGNLQTSAAAARASGYVGSANSWLNSLKNVGNIFNEYLTPAQAAG